MRTDCRVCSPWAPPDNPFRTEAETLEPASSQRRSASDRPHERTRNKAFSIPLGFEPYQKHSQEMEEISEMVYPSSTMNRRKFLLSTASAGVASVMSKKLGAQDPEIAPITAEIRKRHDEGVERLQQWIRQPSIAAENRGVNEGCELTMRMLREAGFGQITKLPTDGQPGIFATLDAGAPRTLGLYFMYDVKQADPAEWTSPPWTAALVDRPGLGKVLVGRGAVNQMGPGAAARHSFEQQGTRGQPGVAPGAGTRDTGVARR